MHIIFSTYTRKAFRNTARHSRQEVSIAKVGTDLALKRVQFLTISRVKASRRLRRTKNGQRRFPLLVERAGSLKSGIRSRGEKERKKRGKVVDPRMVTHARDPDYGPLGYVETRERPHRKGVFTLARKTWNYGSFFNGLKKPEYFSK